jgi:hypothetical protein
MTEATTRHAMASSPARRRRIATKLSEIPDGQLTCRAGRHDWPLDKLQNGKALPRGLAAVPQNDGCYQMRDTCQRCGKVRVVTTLPRGIFDVSADFAYSDPADWVTLADELDVTKRDLRAENIARSAGRLFSGSGS